MDQEIEIAEASDREAHGEGLLKSNRPRKTKVVKWKLSSDTKTNSICGGEAILAIRPCRKKKDDLVPLVSWDGGPPWTPRPHQHRGGPRHLHPRARRHLAVS